ncbi:YciI family protein [Staphylococcus haemolyticus]|uniref:YciI family protein n=1 Tax=Staphylococcus haemolyticus TaxID=1283 RepID=UPI0015D7138C|nr:YciI family protein [Staphylococcus haemolyticus]
MKHYIVKFEHTDLKRWKKYVVTHVLYLKKLIKQRHLIVSGPTVNARKDIKEAYLIFKVKNRDELMTLLEKDPFWYKGLVSNYTIEEWKPLFGNLEQLTNEEFNDEE